MTRIFAIVAPAKINLRLKVVGRRLDGYHLLSMLNVTLKLSDELGIRILPERGFTLELSGAFSEGVPVEGNILERAYRSFLDRFPGCRFGVAVHLTKKIPHGTGLGGGSSDCAALLKLLRLEQARNEQCSDFELIDDLIPLALSLGADVPYSLFGGLAAVGGVGEAVQPLEPLPTWDGDVGLFVPPERISTTTLYSMFRERNPELAYTDDKVLLDALEKRDVRCSTVKRFICNDFEPLVVQLVPAVGAILSVLRELPGCTASVTGSGSAVFALFHGPINPEDPQFERAFKELDRAGVSTVLTTFA